MSRQIKFGAYDKKRNMWYHRVEIGHTVDGTLKVKGWHKDYGHDNRGDDLSWEDIIEIITLKNGREIFEGDIIEVRPTDKAILRGVIKWVDDGMDIGYHCKMLPLDEEGSLLPWSLVLRDGHIVGNAYENPELVEGD